MTYISKDSRSIGFVLYSEWGLQSHILMDTNDEVFTCNPDCRYGDKSAITYKTLEDANAAKDNNTFYDKVVEVVLIAKVENYH